ncbi:actin-binding ADF family protein [Streptomyces chryseus]
MTVSVSIDEQVLDDYKKLTTRKINYQLCRISDDCTQIIVDKSGKADSYAEFVAMLPENDPRYAIHDFEFTTSDGRKSSKIVMFYWLPDSSSIKAKMVYASSKSALRSTLSSIAVEVQATDLSDMDVEEVKARVVR